MQSPTNYNHFAWLGFLLTCLSLGLLYMVVHHPGGAGLSEWEKWVWSIAVMNVGIGFIVMVVELILLPLMDKIFDPWICRIKERERQQSGSGANC